jgi:hypothetical protein
VILSVCGVVSLALGSMLGGELVFRHGRRVELEPALDGDPRPVAPEGDPEPPAPAPERPPTAG